MSEEIRCKRIINGKTYNTDTAAVLGEFHHEDDIYTETLFKTRYGAYFFHIWLPTKPEERIIPCPFRKAKKWMEENCDATKFEAEFGQMPEAGDDEARITLRLPKTLRNRIALIAEAKGQSLNAWIVKSMENYAGKLSSELSSVRAKTPSTRIRRSVQ